MTDITLSNTKIKKVKRLFLAIMGIRMSKKSKRKVNVDEKEHLDRQDSTFNEVAFKHTEYPGISSPQTGSEYNESEGNFSSKGITLKMQNKEKNEISCSNVAVPTDKHQFEEFIDLSENKTNFNLTRWSKGEHITCREKIGGNKTNYSREDGSRYGPKSVISMHRGKHDGRCVQQTVHSCTGHECLIPRTVTESQNSNYKQAIIASKSDTKFRPWTAKGEKLIFHSNTATEKNISYKCLEKKQDIYSSTGESFVFLTNDGGTLECASCLVPATDTLRSEQSNEPRKVKNISYGHRKHLESISKEKEMYLSGETKKHQNKRSSFTLHGGYKMNIKVNPPSDIMDIYLPGHVLGHMEPN